MIVGLLLSGCAAGQREVGHSAGSPAREALAAGGQQQDAPPAASEPAGADEAPPLSEGRIYAVTISIGVPGGLIWWLQVRPDGSGQLQFSPSRGDHFFPGRFPLTVNEMVRKLEPSLQRSPTSEGPYYSVRISHERGLLRYITSDVATVASIFEEARAVMFMDSIEQFEVNPPPGRAASTPDWESVRQQLARSTFGNLWPEESRFPPADPETLRAVLLEGRPISREEYRQRFRRGAWVEGVAMTPDGQRFDWRVRGSGIAIVRPPDHNTVLLEVQVAAE